MIVILSIDQFKIKDICQDGSLDVHDTTFTNSSWEQLQIQCHISIDSGKFTHMERIRQDRTSVFLHLKEISLILFVGTSLQSRRSLTRYLTQILHILGIHTSDIPFIFVCAAFQRRFQDCRCTLTYVILTCTYNLYRLTVCCLQSGLYRFTFTRVYSICCLNLIVSCA